MYMTTSFRRARQNNNNIYATHFGSPATRRAVSEIYCSFSLVAAEDKVRGFTVHTTTTTTTTSMQILRIDTAIYMLRPCFARRSVPSAAASRSGEAKISIIYIRALAVSI